MLFNSLSYIFYLPLAVFAYYLIPYKYRWALLLVLSYFFYMCWEVNYALLIMTSTLTVFYTGQKIHQTEDRKEKRKYLYLSLIVNLGILFFFKYYNFTAFNINWILNEIQFEQSIPYLDILLPVGISFYTFQAISYTADIYLEKIKPEKHLGYFALYVSFFPQLVAGPIERVEDLLPQFRKKINLNYSNFLYGINKILLGMFKKVVVADTLSIYVNHVMMNTESASGLQLYAAVIFFGIQMFCDFSGYSDIAIGSARLMGIKLSENFNQPFKALSINDYWSRWHMTLTNWIRDYIFYPIMYSRPNRMIINTLVVFIIIGIWHGASMNFVIFGLIHGTLSIVQMAYGKSKFLPQFNSKWGIPIKWFVNLQLLMLTAVFFRATSFDQAIYILKTIFLDFHFKASELFIDFSPLDFSLYLFLIGLLGVTAFFNKELNFRKNFAYIGIMLILILVFGQNKEVQFIYFQF